MTEMTSAERKAVLPDNRLALGRWMCMGMLATVLLLFIALNAWGMATIPVRAFLLGGFLCVLVLLYPDAAKRAVTRHTMVFALAAALAVLGTFISIVNGAGFDRILRSVLEVHVQIALSLILATIVAEIAGARSAALVIVCCVGLSALVAMLQFAGYDFAWQLRETLGKIQDQAIHEDSSFLNRRPMGLSFSPIQLSTQLCLAFAVYAAVAERQRIAQFGPNPRPSPLVLAAVVMLVAASIAAATRSPILGAGIFLVAYLAKRQSALLLVMLLAGGALAYFVGEQLIEVFQSKQARLVRVNDDSAMGRLALWKFGLLLFRDNPLGYGFGFIPAKQYWMPYWQELYTLQGADDIKSKELHNYVLIMLNTYGVGLLLVVPLVVALLRRAGGHLLYFIPYVAHIMFHNSGPFWNDMMIWFVIGTISAVASTAPLRNDQDQPGAMIPAGGLSWR